MAGIQEIQSFHRFFIKSLHYFEVKTLSHLQIFATPWIVAYKAPLYGIFQSKYWNGLPASFSGDLPKQGSNQGFPHCRQMLYWPSRFPWLSLSECHLNAGTLGSILCWGRSPGIFWPREFHRQSTGCKRVRHD